MNEYIHNLPAEEWEQVILDDFNTIFHTKIMDSDTDVTKFRCDEVISDIQRIEKNETDNKTPENKMFIENIDEPEFCEDI